MWPASRARARPSPCGCRRRIAEPAAAPEVKPAALAAGTETVLLVEDDDSVRAPLRKALDLYGYRVVAACDGEDALDRFESAAGAVDLVVTDIVMPHMSGPELVDRMRKINPEVRVLYVSGYPERSLELVNQRSAERGRRVGAAAEAVHARPAGARDQGGAGRARRRPPGRVGQRGGWRWSSLGARLKPGTGFRRRGAPGGEECSSIQEPPHRHHNHPHRGDRRHARRAGAVAWIPRAGRA